MTVVLMMMMMMMSCHPGHIINPWRGSFCSSSRRVFLPQNISFLQSFPLDRRDVGHAGDVAMDTC